MTKQKKEQVQYLLKQYLEGLASEKEQSVLFQLLEEEDSEEWQNILEEIMAAEPEFAGYDRTQWQPVVQKILEGQTKKRGLLKKLYIKWAAAAAILLILLFGTWLIMDRPQKQDKDLPIASSDIPAPNVAKAQIKLADGRIVSLDSLNSGLLAVDGNMQVVKNADGSIIYENATKYPLNTEPVYNTITNPRGSMVISLKLSDGSKVWLNSGSSITYPVAFVGGDRMVSMEGEAYFEISTIYDVRGTIKTPFIVEKGDMKVQVLGTHFNVNAYDDEDEIKVTLLEGSVIVNRNSSLVNLKPGQQALVNRTSSIVIRKSIDLDQIMSWKNGWFDFDDTDLPAIMKQVSRWYDVEVVYKGRPANKFGGRISRSLPLSSILKMMGENGIRYNLEGKKLTIN